MSASGPLNDEVTSTTLPQNGAQSRPRSLDPAALLSRLWQQSLPLIRARVQRLEELAQESCETGEITAPACTEAADIAHKLAGSLGMFGYPKGTDLARELENLLENDAALVPTEFRRLGEELRSVLPL